MVTPEARAKPSTHALSNASVKRIAWAFGCSRRGSDEEAVLHRLLVEKIAQEDTSS